MELKSFFFAKTSNSCDGSTAAKASAFRSWLLCAFGQNNLVAMQTILTPNVSIMVFAKDSPVHSLRPRLNGMNPWILVQPTNFPSESRNRSGLNTSGSGQLSFVVMHSFNIQTNKRAFRNMITSKCCVTYRVRSCE